MLSKEYLLEDLLNFFWEDYDKQTFLLACFLKLKTTSHSSRDAEKLESLSL